MALGDLFASAQGNDNNLATSSQPQLPAVKVPVLFLEKKLGQPLSKTKIGRNPELLAPYSTIFSP